MTEDRALIYRYDRDTLRTRSLVPRRVGLYIQYPSIERRRSVIEVD